MAPGESLPLNLAVPAVRRRPNASVSGRYTGAPCSCLNGEGPAPGPEAMANSPASEIDGYLAAVTALPMTPDTWGSLRQGSVSLPGCRADIATGRVAWPLTPSGTGVPSAVTAASRRRYVGARSEPGPGPTGL